MQPLLELLLLSRDCHSEQARQSSLRSKEKEVAIDEDTGSLLALLISLSTLVTGLIALIGEAMGWRDHQEDGEQDEAIEDLASDLQQVGVRLDEYEAQLDGLNEEKLEKLR